MKLNNNISNYEYFILNFEFYFKFWIFYCIKTIVDISKLVKKFDDLIDKNYQSLFLNIYNSWYQYSRINIQDLYKLLLLGNIFTINTSYQNEILMLEQNLEEFSKIQTNFDLNLFVEITPLINLIEDSQLTANTKVEIKNLIVEICLIFYLITLHQKNINLVNNLQEKKWCLNENYSLV